jgi:hypothetical protein
MKNFKEYVNEMMGLMGGDQRNRSAVYKKVYDDNKFDGKRIQFDFDSSYSSSDNMKKYYDDEAAEAGVQIKIIYGSTMEIAGKKGQIIKFLKSNGFKPREYKEYF